MRLSIIYTDYKNKTIHQKYLYKKFSNEVKSIGYNYSTQNLNYSKSAYVSDKIYECTINDIIYYKAKIKYKIQYNKFTKDQDRTTKQICKSLMLIIPKQNDIDIYKMSDIDFIFDDEYIYDKLKNEFISLNSISLNIYDCEKIIDKLNL